MKKRINLRILSVCIVYTITAVLCGCSSVRNSIESAGVMQEAIKNGQEYAESNTTEPSIETVQPDSETESGIGAEQPVYTVKQLLQTALEPVGSTLYTYGGGWNEEDTGAGESAVTIGVSPKWREFYERMDADYDSSEHRYEIENGLDCTGYIGWVIYNVFNTENGNSGYVFLAENLVHDLASMGLGNVTERGMITDRLPGDIMGSSTAHHAWITVGECEDGSVVLLHSSPPGVGLCAASAAGDGSSQADELVRYYMSRYYPEYYGRYPDSTRGKSYLTDYDCFRWNDYILEDPDNYRNMTAEQVLEDLFNNK